MSIKVKSIIDQENSSRRLIAFHYGNEVTFHILGEPNDMKVIEAEYGSPNTVADIVMNHFGFVVSSESIVEMSNWI